MGSRVAVRTLLIGLATAAICEACNRTSQPSISGVVIVTLDTTRADRLSPYGFMDVATPALDRLARDGIVFERAMSVAPVTLPAHTSLFTGLFPPGHGVRDNSDEALDGKHVTLAERLRAAGFHTAAFVGSAVLASSRGLAQGFDTYDGPPQHGLANQRGQRRAAEVIADATAWLEKSSADRFFLWAHIYDPHRPYDPSGPFRSKHVDPHVGEILAADAALGQLMNTLEQRKLLGETIVIVAGDHGESLGEHGERDHGVFMYDSVMRVPLIMRVPGLVPGRSGVQVRLIDVMPTLLDLLNLPASKEADGVSLSGLLRGTQTMPELDAYGESRYPERLGWSPLFALTGGRYKLIDAPRPELYDLQRDPFEERNIHGDRPMVAAAMHARLDALRRRGSGQATLSTTGVTADQRERLAALGYASGGRSGTGSEPRPDPKDCIGLLNTFTDGASARAVQPLVPCR